MKAILSEIYGPPETLRWREVEKPAPKDDEVLIKVHAASVNAADWRLLSGSPFLVRLMHGLFKPRIKIPGADIAGIVEATGAKVVRFKTGDEVFGDLSGCDFGGFAEYATAPENALALKPSGISFEEAAAFPMAAVTALQALRDKGAIRQGEKVLINGSSGGVGTFAVQLADYFGAEVTAVCSEGKMAQALSLGASRAIDYAKEDITRNSQKYDLILAVNGYQPISAYKRALVPGGRYVMIGGSNKQIFQSLLLGPWMSDKSGRKIMTLSAKPNPADLDFLMGLYLSGKIKPVIDRRFPLRETPEAFSYIKKGHAQGKIIIIMN